MKKSNYIIRGFLSAAGVLTYVATIMWALFNAEKVFGKQFPEPNFLIPVMMLLLFIVSACITGALVLGKPIHLYLSGLKKEAVVLLFSTVTWLVVFLGGVVGALLTR